METIWYTLSMGQTDRYSLLNHLFHTCVGYEFKCFYIATFNGEVEISAQGERQ